MIEVLYRLANETDMESVYRLTHDSFVQAGLSKIQKTRQLVHFPELDGITETKVIVAEVDNKIVGTNSITFDSSAGVHTDKFFPEETKLIRQEGRRLASSWRIAVEPEFRNQLKVLRALLKGTIEEALKADIETCLFTFYEKHERIYQKLINAKSLCRKTYSNEFYSDKTQVLMRVDKESFPKW
ncbi:GNAT family N-acetyltransferase [Reinekea sp. G2M2-21]|uniref:GNAT family N-acetyltransferase n=1 Tax=Reinekea sp. G2M2-21 TaxID=2788942 RepID=UPI0018AB49D6|nr:GNAT family N-acetyltransferase [Reinekea sp. G2M2-21]